MLSVRQYREVLVYVKYVGFAFDRINEKLIVFSN